MNRLVQALAAVCALALFAVMFSALDPHSAEATANIPVTVTNAPLPVQGSVSVANTPAVTVNGSVAIANATNDRGSTIPLAVSEIGQPYQSFCGTGFATSENPTCELTPVPAGMRLVVQEFDANATSPAGSSVSRIALGLQFQTVEPVYHAFPISSNGNNLNGLPVQAVHQRTLLFADPGTTPTCEFEEANVFWGATCNLSGYLVPAQ